MVLVLSRDRFLRKKCVNQSVGALGLANGGRGAVGTRIGASPPHWGGDPSAEKIDFGSQIGEFWCKLGVFYSSPKAGLNAVPTVKIALGTQALPLETIPGSIK